MAVSTNCASLRDPGTSRDYDVLVRQAISTASGLSVVSSSARMSVGGSLPGALLVALPPMNRGQAESCF